MGGGSYSLPALSGHLPLALDMNGADPPTPKAAACYSGSHQRGRQADTVGGWFGEMASFTHLGSTLLTALEHSGSQGDPTQRAQWQSLCLELYELVSRISRLRSSHS